MTADERANGVMDKFGWGHGDLPGRRFAHETIAAAIRAAVLAEREACAEIVKQLSAGANTPSQTLLSQTALVRICARGTP